MLVKGASGVKPHIAAPVHYHGPITRYLIEWKITKLRRISCLLLRPCWKQVGIGSVNWERRGATLQWRHNGHDGVSNHQPHYCLFNRLFWHRSKKTSKLRVAGLCAGNSPVTGEFPAQRASNAENVSIWWRHHERLLLEILVNQFIIMCIMCRIKLVIYSRISMVEWLKFKNVLVISLHTFLDIGLLIHDGISVNPCQ